jgi:hypothetical protein
MAVGTDLTVSRDQTVEGTLTVGVDIVLRGQDCAEDFETLPESDVTPGTVMVVDNAGVLRHSTMSYDSRVAGVVSGAAPYRPGLVLGRLVEKTSAESPIALVGRVSCKVDATFGSIASGDLLTTSPTPGHAMKATDRYRAFGAIVGKALQPMESGRGFVTILVCLQ